MTATTYVRTRRCRYCGAEILDDWSGMIHEYTCGKSRRWEKT